MTGYGRGESVQADRQLVVEINAVNHRYLDTNIRLPRTMKNFEEDINSYIKNNIARGKVDIYINYESQAQDHIAIEINEALCEEYIKTFRKVQEQFDLEGNLPITAIMELPDIMTVEKQPEDQDLIWGMLESALTQATQSLNQMREKEGNILKDDLMMKSKTIDKIIQNITTRSPIVVQEYEERLHKKITEALSQVDMDQERLLMEVAIFSDRSSIDEELTRLGSHMKQLGSILSCGGVVGRKLDFLLQEINRESNTIGSKANDQLIAQYVVDLKSEIEKIREQIQNIE